MTINNSELLIQLQKAGLGFLKLERGNGYFYVRSDNTYASNVLMGLPSTSIPVCFFKHQTIETWVNDMREIWEAALTASGIDRGANSKVRSSEFKEETYNFIDGGGRYAL